MKRALAILLAALMLLALFSCAAKEEAAPPEQSPSASPSSAPESAQPPEEPSAPASQTPDVSVNEDSVGYFSSGVDPRSRDTYEIVWAYAYTLLLFEKMTECFKQYEDKLNVKITPMTAESDIDKYLINIETLAQQGTDGFVIHLDVATKARIVEVLDETGKPYICMLNSYRDDDGNSLVPTVGTDQYAAGADTLQWLYDNYKTYWGDIDTTNVALMNLTLSVSVDLNDRAIGAEDLFKKYFPENEDLIFMTDGASGSGARQDIAYNLASATFAGNPDIEYWFVTSCLEDYAQGVARAAEQVGIEDRVLIVDVGSDILCSEWDTGYDGSWKACLGISNYLYTTPALCGLVAILDGVSTPESLWPDMKKAGDVAAFYASATQMITKDTYKSYFNGMAEQAGMPLPYTS